MREKAAKQTNAGKRFRIFMIIAALVVFGTFGCTYYLSRYYEASEIALEAMKGNSRVSVVENEDYYLFLPVKDEASGTGIIFYPGGKVDERAYAPLMVRLAESGYEVYLMRMPAKLAVFKPSAADAVTDHAAVEDVSDLLDSTETLPAELDPERRWILMGHSLGGAMAANYTAKHSERVSALVLLAAYSTEDLADSGIEVLCMYGSEDGVLNREKYEKYRTNLPKDAKELVIDGGNHAGFAFYGEQKGDHPAQISAEEQQETVLDALSYLLQPTGT